MKKRKEIPGSCLTGMTREALYQNWPKDQVDEDLAKLAEYKSRQPAGPKKAIGPPLVKGDKGPRVYPKPTSISDEALKLRDELLVPFYGALVKSERARVAAGLPPAPAPVVEQESTVVPDPVVDPNEIATVPLDHAHCLIQAQHDFLDWWKTHWSKAKCDCDDAYLVWMAARGIEV